LLRAGVGRVKRGVLNPWDGKSMPEVRQGDGNFDDLTNLESADDWESKPYEIQKKLKFGPNRTFVSARAHRLLSHDSLTRELLACERAGRPRRAHCALSRQPRTPLTSMHCDCLACLLSDGPV
jgi:hypothetical protein